MLIGTLADVRKRRRGAPSLGYYAPTLPADGPTAPVGFIFLIDPDGAYLVDSDGAYLVEAI